MYVNIFQQFQMGVAGTCWVSVNARKSMQSEIIHIFMFYNKEKSTHSNTSDTECR